MQVAPALKTVAGKITTVKVPELKAVKITTVQVAPALKAEALRITAVKVTPLQTLKNGHVPGGTR